MDKIIQVEKLTKIYRKDRHQTVVLKDISFDLNQKECLCIVGPSGSGKSTLLHMLGGLDNPTSGQISINNQLLNNLNDKQLSAFRNQTIGFVFQFFYLQDYLTAQENVMLPARITNSHPQDSKGRAIELLEMVGLRHRLNHYPNEMSGGEMQRVAIARALINEPQLLLADEPTGNLDGENSKIVMEIFKKLHQQQLSVILVTHDEKLSQTFENVLHVDKGTLCQGLTQNT